jgi:hypothetical protein
MLTKRIIEKLNQTIMNSAKKEFLQTLKDDPQFLNINIEDFTNQKQIIVQNFSNIANPFYEDIIDNDKDSKDLASQFANFLKNQIIEISKKSGDNAKILINDVSYDKNRDEVVIKKFAVQ